VWVFIGLITIAGGCIVYYAYFYCREDKKARIAEEKRVSKEKDDEKVSKDGNKKEGGEQETWGTDDHYARFE